MKTFEDLGTQPGVISKPISKLFEDMSFDELTEERKQEWLLLKSDTGWWLCRNQLPLRYFKRATEAESMCQQFGIKITHVNTAQPSPDEVRDAARKAARERKHENSPQCWCEPVITIMSDGCQTLVHRLV